MTKDTWSYLRRLIAPQKKRFALATLFAVLSTGAMLVEPLVYREAINDISGLFVKASNDSFTIESGGEIEEVHGRVDDFIKQRTEQPESKPQSQAPSPSIQDKKERKAGKKIQGNKDLQATQEVSQAAHLHTGAKKIRKRHVKLPHTRGKIAERTPGEAAKTLLWAVGILFLVNIFGYIFWLAGEVLNARLTCRLEQSFIEGAFRHVLNLPLEFFSKRSPAALAKQIDQSEAVNGIINALSQQILPQVISLLVILTVMVCYNLTLTAVSVAVIPIYFFLTWSSSKKLETGLSEYYERWEQVNSRIIGALSGIKTVKLSGAEQHEVSAYSRVADQAFESYVQRAVLSNSYAFWQGILTHFARAAVLGYGGYLVLLHQLTPGDVVMFVAYLERLYAPIEGLSSLWVNILQYTGSISRAFRLLDNHHGEKKGAPLTVTEGAIEMDEIYFGYTPGSDVLNGVSLKFRPGQITALVGGSGAGKTTTVDVLLKLYCKLPRQRDSSKLEVERWDCCFLGWFVADEIRWEGGFPGRRADARHCMTSSTRG